MKEIGGYFELELFDNGSFPHESGYCVNSGRNALELILSNIGDITLLWIPLYTCDVILEPLEKLQIPYNFYHIDHNLEASQDILLNKGEYILITNYFGIKDDYVLRMAKKYGERIIVDNSQAFLADSVKGIRMFYSPRKFVGVPDGGIAVTPEILDLNEFKVDCSYDRCSHLLKRYDCGASEGYSDFRRNALGFVKKPICRMSNLTKALLSNINFKALKERRLENFLFLHRRLGNTNSLKIPSFSDFACPMIYPYYTEETSMRVRLIENKVYVPTYWPNVLKWCTSDELEYNLTNNIIPLPIDQRYGMQEMESILNIIGK